MFRSDHEGAAVIFEEMQETENELKNVQEYFKALWESVKQNVDAEWCGESIKIASVNLACEAIQVSAMGQKFIDSQKDREEKEDNQPEMIVLFIWAHLELIFMRIAMGLYILWLNTAQ